MKILYFINLYEYYKNKDEIDFEVLRYACKTVGEEYREKQEQNYAIIHFIDDIVRKIEEILKRGIKEPPKEEIEKFKNFGTFSYDIDNLVIENDEEFVAGKEKITSEIREIETEDFDREFFHYDIIFKLTVILEDYAKKNNKILEDEFREEIIWKNAILIKLEYIKEILLEKREMDYNSEKIIEDCLLKDISKTNKYIKIVEEVHRVSEEFYNKSIFGNRNFDDDLKNGKLDPTEMISKIKKLLEQIQQIKNV
jgi:hypothetical protein